MKYTNKGHEYDDVWQNIAAKKKFYLLVIKILGQVNKSHMM